MSYPESGNCKPVGKRFHRADHREGRILQPNVCRGWWIETHHRPKEIELLLLNSSLQDGRTAQGEGCNPPRGLHGQIGSQRCLSNSWKNHRKYLKFKWQGTCYQFKSLPFGLATAPRVFEDPTTCDGRNEEERDPIHCVSGWYFDFGTNSRSTQRAHADIGRLSPVSGICHQSEEVPLGTQTGNRIPAQVV